MALVRVLEGSMTAFLAVGRLSVIPGRFPPVPKRVMTVGGTASSRWVRPIMATPATASALAVMVSCSPQRRQHLLVHSLDRSDVHGRGEGVVGRLAALPPPVTLAQTWPGSVRPQAHWVSRWGGGTVSWLPRGDGSPPERQGERYGHKRHHASDARRTR
jgi:hypothetical protein